MHEGTDEPGDKTADGHGGGTAHASRIQPGCLLARQPEHPGQREHRGALSGWGKRQVGIQGAPGQPGWSVAGEAGLPPFDEAAQALSRVLAVQDAGQQRGEVLARRIWALAAPHARVGQRALHAQGCLPGDQLGQFPRPLDVRPGRHDLLIAVGFAYVLRGRGGDVISRAAGSGVLDEGALAAKAELAQEIDQGKAVPPGITGTDTQRGGP